MPPPTAGVTVESTVVEVFLSGERSAGGGDVAVLGGGGHATLPCLVEDQHGGATLEAGVAALAGPVPAGGLVVSNESELGGKKNMLE